MLAPSSDLLRTGLALKLNQVKLATRSYLRDRTDQATGTATSYAVAAGLFAVAGIFLVAACLVGIAALFRWVEIKYGLFHAFAVAGGLLLVIAAISAAFAVMKLNRPSPRFPSLGSRLRVAVKATPNRPDQVGAMLASPAPPRVNPGRPGPRLRSRRDNRDVRTGLILMATLLGWAAVRRRRQAQRL